MAERTCTSPKEIETQGATPSAMLLSRANSDTTEVPEEKFVDTHSREFHINTSLFLYTFFVVFATAGLGALMIFWFVRHSTQDSLAAAWKEGAFLLDEGTRLEGGSEAARLTGLTIASAIVSDIGCGFSFALTQALTCV